MNSIVETDDGNFMMVGSVVHGNSGYPCSFSWLTNKWIMKVNKNGKVLWQKSYGCIPKGKKCSHNWEEANDIIKIDGDYAIVGNKHNYINNPNRLFWFMKINESGHIIKQFTRSNIYKYDEPFIESTSRGGYIWKTWDKKKGTLLYRPSNKNETSLNIYNKNYYLKDKVLTKDGGFIIVNSSGLIKTDQDLNYPKITDNVTSKIYLISDYKKDDQTNMDGFDDSVVTSNCTNTNFSSSFQICPETGTSLSKTVKNKKTMDMLSLGKTKDPGSGLLMKMGIIRSVKPMTNSVIIKAVLGMACLPKVDLMAVRFPKLRMGDTSLEPLSTHVIRVMATRMYSKPIPRA